MEKIVFLVQGSADLPYTVTFERNSNRVAAFCTCPAGENGMYCKHRLSILDSVDPGIVSINADQVAVIASWLPGSNLAACMAEITETERNLEKAKKAVVKAKKKLAVTMLGR